MVSMSISIPMKTPSFGVGLHCVSGQHLGRQRYHCTKCAPQRPFVLGFWAGFHREFIGISSHMLHGAGILTNMYPKNCPNVGKYYMEHLGMVI